jgi:hypothetical protein
VRITIKKFHLAFEQYQFFDLNIALKKLKHRIVDSIDDKTADSLGLSRAVLVNDQLKKFQDQVENSENFCRSLIGRLECLLVDYNEEQRYLNGMYFI